MSVYVRKVRVISGLATVQMESRVIMCMLQNMEPFITGAESVIIWI